MADTNGTRGIDRRTLVKGAAWSVPLIAVGPALPALALTTPVTITAEGQACKLPGNSTPPLDKGYVFGVRVDNALDQPIQLRVIALRQRGVSKTYLGAQIAPNTIQTAEGCATRPDECVVYLPGAGNLTQPIPAKGCLAAAAFAEDFTNSGSGVVEIDYEWYDATGTTLLGSATADFDLRGGSWPGGCRPFGVSREAWTCALPGEGTDPIIDQIIPDTGSTTGGYSVTIFGDNLTCTTAVFFGAVPQQVGITNVSDTEIQVVVPASAVTGPVNVGIITCNGSSASDQFGTFTYV